MRTWLILLALVALVCASASHQEHGASRKRYHSSRRLHQKGLRHARQRGLREEQSAVGPVAQEHVHVGESVVHEEKDDDIQEQKAAMARFLVHNSNSIAMGTKGSLQDYTKYVGSNVELVSDVIDGKSTGIPYVYMCKKDPLVQDLNKNNHASMFFSRLVIDGFCEKLPLSVTDPKCARALLVGKIVRVNDTEEEESALKSIVDKVPGLLNVKYEDHVLGRMDIEAVFIIDQKGELEPVDLELYKKAKPEDYALANV